MHILCVHVPLKNDIFSLFTKNSIYMYVKVHRMECAWELGTPLYELLIATMAIYS